MDRFIHRENVAHYRRLLAEASAPSDRGRHKMLVHLLAVEMAKDVDARNVHRTTKIDSDEQ